jgi:diguanylate cyclase (GGDEF)-like protein
MDNIRSNDFVIRYGGNEFLIILRNCSEETGYIIIDRIAQSLNIYRDFALRISYGIARYSDTVEKTTSEADKKMYCMKGK